MTIERNGAAIGLCALRRGGCGFRPHHSGAGLVRRIGRCAWRGGGGLCDDRAARGGGGMAEGAWAPVGLLAGYRVLDLADETGAYCTKTLADLGADVLKVEPPEGCSSRRLPPFAGDQPDAERSLFHLYYHAGRRSVTLDLDSASG